MQGKKLWFGVVSQGGRCDLCEGHRWWTQIRLRSCICFALPPPPCVPTLMTELLPGRATERNPVVLAGA